jgi:hypothetical protein
MHLNEFADPKIYTLPADDVATVIKQLERIWCDPRLENLSTPILGRESSLRTGVVS